MKFKASAVLIVFGLLTCHRACGQEQNGVDLTKLMSQHRVLILNDTESHCDSLYFAADDDIDDQPQNWQNGYDTVQLFLEQCPFYPNAAQMFVLESEAAQALVGENKLTWDQQLAWLKSVLYLNPDTGWYCEDVGDILQAVQNDSNEVSSVLQYIYNSGKCPILNGEWLSREASVHTHWLDSIYKKYGYPPYGNNPTAADSINADTLAHPFVDTTTFPPVTQIGLSILLGPQYGVVGPSAPVNSQALLSAQLIENPVRDNEIDVSYQMGHIALVTMQLSDVLGRAVPIANAKYQLEQPGSHNVTIPAPNLPAGTYYLRITTDVGDAITLKVVKE